MINEGRIQFGGFAIALLRLIINANRTELASATKNPESDTGSRKSNLSYIEMIHTNESPKAANNATRAQDSASTNDKTKDGKDQESQVESIPNIE